MIRTQLSNTLLTKILALGGAIVQGIFVTRLLGPEGKGLLSYFQANVAFFTLALGFAVPTAMTYFSANEKIAVRKLLGIGYAMALTAVVIVAGLVVVSLHTTSFDLILPRAAQSRFYGLYFCISFFCFFINGIYTQIFAGKSKFATVNRIELLVVSARVVTFGSFFLWARQSSAHTTGDGSLWTWIFLADLFFTVATYLIYFLATRISLREQADFAINWRRDFKPVFKFIMPLYLAAVTAFLYNRCDLWILEHVRGLKDVGLYSVAAGGAQLLLFFPTAINSVLYTYLTKATPENRLSIFSKISKANLVFVGLACSGLMVISGWLIPALYGESFASAVQPFRILLIANFMVSIKFLFTLFNQITENLRENIISELIVGVISLALNLTFIPIYGLLGASVTLLFSHTLALVFLLIKFRTRQSVNLNAFLIPNFVEINSYGVHAWEYGESLYATVRERSSNLMKRPRPPR